MSWLPNCLSLDRAGHAETSERTKLSADHAAQRREKRQHNRDSGTTCFACRSVGHAARDCPNVLLALEKGVEGVEGAAAMLGDGEAKSKPEENGQKRGMKRKQGKKGGDVVGGKCYRCVWTDPSLKHTADSQMQWD